MIRRRGCLPLCFVKVLKCGLVLAESALVLAGPALGGVAAKKSALKELKALEVTVVLLGGLKGCPENMLDKRGMRDKGPKMRALSALCALKVFLCVSGLWVPPPCPLTRRCRVSGGDLVRSQESSVAEMCEVSELSELSRRECSRCHG
jgi:hypothetical protein